MRILMGDSEAVAVETCQEIVNNYMSMYGNPRWNKLGPILRGVLDKQENAVTTCQEIFNKYLIRKGLPITGIVAPTHVHPNHPSSMALDVDFWEVHASDRRRTVRDIWQEYAHGLNGRGALREKERAHGKKWRRGLIDPKTRKQGQALNYFWCRFLPIYLFIEMRIAMGDSEAVAVDICHEIVNHDVTESGFPNWRTVSPFLRRVLNREKTAVETCQQIFNKYQTKKDRPITVIAVDQAPSPRRTTVEPRDSSQVPRRTARDIWQEYAHGFNGQEPLREKESRGVEWRRDPVDPKTGKRGYTLKYFWCAHLPVYRFIEMRILMGDSEAVAVETCQEIVNQCQNLSIVGVLLRGVLDRKKNAMATCQEIFNVYLTRNGRPITEIVHTDLPTSYNKQR
jgi:hypothetical protein